MHGVLPASPLHVLFIQQMETHIQPPHWTLLPSSQTTVWSLDHVMRLVFYSDQTFYDWIMFPHCIFFYPGHIPSLIKADMLDPSLTRLVAVNSIYFKGLWKSRFQPENTKMRPFTRGDGNVYKVPMMSQLSVFNIGEHWQPAWLTLTIWIFLIRALIHDSWVCEPVFSMFYDAE